MTLVVRRCTDMRLAPGEFSGGREARCIAVLDCAGEYRNTCGEPCRWIMKKQGHGDPPWTAEDRNA